MGLRCVTTGHVWGPWTPGYRLYREDFTVETVDLGKVDVRWCTRCRAHSTRPA